MHIFVDEAGLFIPNKGRDSWSVVGALAIPDSSFSAAHTALRSFKIANNVPPAKEIDRNVYDQESYHTLLARLANAGCTLYCIGMQGGYENKIEEHRENKKRAVRAGLANATDDHRMAIEDAVKLIDEVSPQLFFQAMCQIHLMYQIINRALSYYDIRFPDALQKFNWRIDRKNVRSITKFEKLIERLMTGMIQARTTSSPFSLYDQLGYSFFPYFKEVSDSAKYRGGINLTGMMFDSYALRSSRYSTGLQLADLVVAGVRKCLKGNFDDNLSASKWLGSLLVKPPSKGVPVVELISYGNTYRHNGERSKIFKSFDLNAQRILI